MSDQILILKKIKHQTFEDRGSTYVLRLYERVWAPQSHRKKLGVAGRLPLAPLLVSIPAAVNLEW
jgi:hypothetical protein